MTHRPPRLALWIHERSLAPHERDAVIGDLIEEYVELASLDARGARRWIWWQTWASLWPNLRRRVTSPALAVPDAAPRGVPGMNGTLMDLRFAFRMMGRQPMMTLVGVVSLGAALALNILLFTLANAVMLRPLPLRNPDELVVLLLQRPTNLNHNLSYPDYVVLRDATTTLAALVAYSGVEATVSDGPVDVAFSGELVSGNFFTALGVPMRHGRGLTDDDDRPDAQPAVVISEALWRERLGGQPLSGQVLRLNSHPFTVVGVADSRFAGMQLGRAAAFWVSIAQARRRGLGGGPEALVRANASWLTVLGRLGSASAESARDELDAILRGQFESRGRAVEPVVLRPGARGDSMLPEHLASLLTLLLVAGVVVLVVSCLNVANLQLARNEARRTELAVRAALGARRGQLVRLMLLDGLLLSTSAGLAGLGAATLLKDHAASLIALFGRPVELAVPIDARVVSSSLALALVAGTVVALLSTWQVLRRHPCETLGDARTVSPARRSTQRAMIVAQFALSMALVTGAALLVRTLMELRRTDLGFEARQVAVLEVAPGMAQIPTPQTPAYFDELLRAVRAVPGVVAAGVSHVMPLDFGGTRTGISVQGYQPSPDEDMELNVVRITPGYFEALGIPILQGRAFDSGDASDQPKRIIVNETMARRYWSNGQAVGGFVRMGDEGPYDIEVVGVVPDVHYRMVREEPNPSFYAPISQWPSFGGVIHVRVQGVPGARLGELRRVIAAVNPRVPLQRTGTLRDQVERNIADERMAGAIGVTLAAVALLLAAAGLYASMAFFVGRRTREIGVRVALGARGADVHALVLREGIALAAAGIGTGLVLAAWVGHALRQQLYGVDRLDTFSLGFASIVLVVVALVASWLPARRAARVDPVIALRES
jgi:predicted permease